MGNHAQRVALGVVALDAAEVGTHDRGRDVHQLLEQIADVFFVDQHGAGIVQQACIGQLGLQLPLHLVAGGERRLERALLRFDLGQGGRQVCRAFLHALLQQAVCAGERQFRCFGRSGSRHAGHPRVGRWQEFIHDAVDAIEAGWVIRDSRLRWQPAVYYFPVNYPLFNTIRCERIVARYQV